MAPSAIVRSRPMESESQPPKICRTSGTSDAREKTRPTSATSAPSFVRYTGRKTKTIWLAVLAMIMPSRNHRSAAFSRRGRSLTR